MARERFGKLRAGSATDAIPRTATVMARERSDRSHPPHG